MNKLSCIIPTYNEARRIGKVLDVVSAHPLIGEVIVVDDGSKDATSDIVKGYPSVRLIIHDVNKGKSTSIYDGCKAATGKFILFLDADLIGLTEECLADLIEPVISGEADVSISYRGNSPRFWKIVGFDYISGERVFKKSMLEPHFEKMLALPKFGLEVFLNSLIIESGARIKIVDWPDVESPFKHSKHGIWQGVKGDIGMMRDIFTTFSFYEPIFQIFRLKRLRVK